MQTLTLVLAGGRSSRMGGPHKPALLLGGHSVIDRVVSAAPDGPAVVVGRGDGLTHEARVVHEDPPFAGPVAAIAAGLAAVSDDPSRVVLLLAGDMPFLDREFLHHLADHAPAMARDETGRLQFLCAAWPESLLRARLRSLAATAGTPAKRLFEGLDVAVLDAPAGTMRDIDSPEDLEAARARVHRTADSNDAPSRRRRNPREERRSTDS